MGWASFAPVASTLASALLTGSLLADCQVLAPVGGCGPALRGFMAGRGEAEQGWVTGQSAASRTHLVVQAGVWGRFGEAHLSGRGQVQDSMRDSVLAGWAAIEPSPPGPTA